MTDNDNASVGPEPSLPEMSQESGMRGPSRWRRSTIVAGVLAFGVALGAGGYALAAMDHAEWRQGLHLAFVQHMVAHALDSVGASAAQEAKVHDIVAAKFAEIAPNPDEHAAMRKQALELLAAPTIDRAAVEKLRLQAVATFDAKSKAVVGSVLDIADQLTPEQRVKLAAELEAMPHDGPMMMGPWGGHHHGGPMFGGPDNGDGGN